MEKAPETPTQEKTTKTADDVQALSDDRADAALRKLSLNVRELVEFVLKSGSIDARYSGKDRMLEGARIHRMLQQEDSKTKQHYASEVFLRWSGEYKGFCFELSGRADAVYKEDGLTVLDEIKTTVTEPGERFKEKAVHLAQAQCYAYFYLLTQGKNSPVPDTTEIAVRLTYYHMKSAKKTVFTHRYTLAELCSHIHALLDSYLVWAQLGAKLTAERNASAEAMPFVYGDYRTGQREMAVAVYRSLRDVHPLFAQAPTGIGKTVSVLFPAYKALCTLGYRRIFYLTAKTQTQHAAEKAVEDMRRVGLTTRSVVLTAKDKICFLTPEQERRCNPEDCPYARDYYDKSGTVLLELLNHTQHFSREVLEEAGRKYEVCPFELSLDLSEWCDLIIGDYNYAFDPNAGLQRYDESASVKDTIYLIDEAHNLTERSRRMYSAYLNKQDFLKLKKLAVAEPVLSRAAAAVNRAFLTLKKSFPQTCFTTEEPGAFEEALVRFLWRVEQYYAMQESSEDNAGAELKSALNDVVLAVRQFLLISEIAYGSDSKPSPFVLRIGVEGSHMSLSLLCLDAAEILKQKIDQRAVPVFFSATLSPPAYYKRVLYNDQSVPGIALPSPYEPDRFKIITDASVSTRYDDREAGLMHIAEDILALIRARRGHYLLFFPSFKYMNDVLDCFIPLYTEGEGSAADILIQNGDMNEEERGAYLAAFRTHTKDMLLGFCVTGGVFGEGVDLSGTALIGAVVVGTSLPVPDEERRRLADYYEEKDGRGFDYAYMYPGMNRVLQAAGRVIRDERDAGILLLIDDRFVQTRYFKLFPRHWQRQTVLTRGNVPKQIHDIAKDFWGRTELIDN